MKILIDTTLGLAGINVTVIPEGEADIDKLRPVSGGDRIRATVDATMPSLICEGVSKLVYEYVGKFMLEGEDG